MKKTTTKKKTNRKLISALGMFMLSAAMLGTSTYAWFTMNKTVTVTGMEVKTKVGDNLLISHVTGTGVAKNADSTFVTSDSTAIKAWLEPVSTNTAAATNFWYTVQAKADGSKLAADTTYIDYDNTTNGGLSAVSDNAYANKFSQDYGVLKTDVTAFAATTDPNNGAVGYVDYTFQLKATNTDNTNPQEIHLTQLDLLYDGTEAPVENAFRVAVFVEPAKENATDSDYFAAGGTTLKKFYKTTTAEYFTAKSGASAADAVSAITTFADEASSDNKLASVPANSTAYYNVVVRL